MKENDSSHKWGPVSSPILHDIVKSYLTHEYKDIFLFCGTLSQLQKARIFSGKTPHRLIEARQEWFFSGQPRYDNDLVGTDYPYDCIWIFQSIYGVSRNLSRIATRDASYLIVHEIKTGEYEIEKEMEKHYLKNNHISFWVWAWSEQHAKNKRPKGAFVKQINLELIMPYIKKSTTKLMERLPW